MEKKKVVYIAGRITGVTEYWKPFEQAEDELTAMGYTVLTPTRLPWDLDSGKAMKICLAMIDQADAVYFLPGWTRSVGANIEMSYCKYIGKPHSSRLTDFAGTEGVWLKK